MCASSACIARSACTRAFPAAARSALRDSQLRGNLARATGTQSPSLYRLLRALASVEVITERERLAADVVVVSDTTMWAPDVPSVCVGMRGLVGFGVALRTATGDLHSGLFGGAVPNAAHVAARLITALHDADGRVTVDPQLVFNAPGWDDELLAALGDRNVSIEGSVTIVGDTLYFAGFAYSVGVLALLVGPPEFRERIGRRVGLGILGQETAQARLGRPHALLLEVVRGYLRLVSSERLAAFPNAQLRAFGPRRRGKAIHDVAERRERARDRRRRREDREREARRTRAAFANA